MVRGKGGKERLAPLNGAGARGDQGLSGGRARASCRKGAQGQAPGCSPRAAAGGRLTAAPLRPAAGRGGRGGRRRSGQGQPARAAPRLRHPPAGRRRRPARRPDPARPRRHRHHPDLHPRRPGPPARGGGDQASAGAARSRAHPRPADWKNPHALGARPRQACGRGAEDGGGRWPPPLDQARSMRAA